MNSDIRLTNQKNTINNQISNKISVVVRISHAMKEFGILIALLKPQGSRLLTPKNLFHQQELFKINGQSSLRPFSSTYKGPSSFNPAI